MIIRNNTVPTMTTKHLYPILNTAIVALSVLTACTKEPFEFTGIDDAGNNDVVIDGVQGSDMTPLAYLDLTLDRGDIATQWALQAQDVPADGDPAYLEHQQFTQQVVIDYTAGGAVVATGVAGVTCNVSGGMVEVYSFVPQVEFVLRGTCANGAFKLATTAGAYKLTLQDLQLTNPAGAALYMPSDVTAMGFIYAQPGTNNVLRGNLQPDCSEKAALKAAADLVFCGTGQLQVAACYKHGVETKGNVYFRGGCQVEVSTTVGGDTSLEEPKDGIHAGGHIVVTGGRLAVNSVGDGMQSEAGHIRLLGGYVTVDTQADKAHGLKSELDVELDHCALASTVGGAAAKCISAGRNVQMSGSQVWLQTSGNPVYDAVAQDISSSAGVKCGGDMTVTDGRLYITSTGAGGKGVNCDGKLSLLGAAVVKVVTRGTQSEYMSLTTSPKCVSADAWVVVDCDTLWLNALGGTAGCEGVATKHTLQVRRGEVRIHSYDDCLSASVAAEVSGGHISAYSEGDDGIDANASVTITDGSMVLCGANSHSGQGIDCPEGALSLQGGSLVCVGGSGVTPAGGSTLPFLQHQAELAEQDQVYYALQADGSIAMMYGLPHDYKPFYLLMAGASLSQERGLYRTTRDNISGGKLEFGVYQGSQLVSDGERL